MRAVAVTGYYIPVRWNVLEFHRMFLKRFMNIKHNNYSNILQKQYGGSPIH